MTPFKAQVLPRAAEISDFTERAGAFLDTAGVDGRTSHHVAMILEELLTNLGTHGGAPDKAADISIAIEPSRVIAEMMDQGPPFDPRSTSDPDIHAPIEDRAVGGLGLFLTRKLAHNLDYVHRDGCNRTTFSVLRS